MKSFPKSRVGVYLLSYPLLVLIGLLDYQTGHEISSSVLYFFPIYLVAANATTRKLDAVLIALFCSLSWILFQLLSGDTYSNSMVIYWNAFVRIITFLLISLLLYRLKRNQHYVEVINQQLEAANAEKNKFLGIAAHDIRNPLANIYNIATLLDLEKSLTPKQQELVVLLKRIASSTLSLLTNLLDISQIEAGALRLKIEKQDYTAFLKEQILFNSRLAESKNQKITYSSDEATIPPLYFDRVYMGQVMSNLLTNASKFSQSNTTIDVRVDYAADAVQTSVRDQGTGIAVQDLQNIFKPFTKGASRPTAGESSSGLGLAIVQKIVQAHGGEVGVKSTYGQGATFYFTLPVN